MAGVDDAIVKIRLSAAQVRQTLDLLDRTGEVVAGSEKRRHTRRRFRLAQSMRMACAREGGHAVYETWPRDISAKGLAALVGAFIHPGTDCVMSVPMLDGERLRLGGRVRACKHVAGAIHEVGIEFAESVDVLCFVHAEAAEPDPTPAVLADIERCANTLALLARNGAPWVDMRAAIREIQDLSGGRA